jgi:hypothetical protein
MAIIQDGLSPFFISVFHELTHYRDVKTTPTNFAEGQYAPGSRPSSLFPTRHAAMEHKTILSALPGDISEINWRREPCEPIRYPHASYNHLFVEPQKTILKTDGTENLTRHTFNLKPMKTSVTRTRLFGEPLKNSHSLQFDSFHVQHIYQKPW